jgi:hypothetical protein
MKQMFVAEAKKYQVLPAGRVGRRAHRRAAAEHHRGAHRVRLHAADGRPAAGRLAAAAQQSYTMTADIDVPQGGAEGMILTSGGRFAGYGFYLLKGKPVLALEPGRPRAPEVGGPRRARAGTAHARVRLQVRGPRCRHARLQQLQRRRPPGTGTLKVDGKVVATKRMEKTLPMILQWDESFDVGSDTLTGVNDADYKPPFALTAKLNKLTIKSPDRPQLSPSSFPDSLAPRRVQARARGACAAPAVCCARAARQSTSAARLGLGRRPAVPR